MNDVAKEKIMEYREIHKGDMGARVLADKLMELGLLDVSKDDRQRYLKDHAVQIIANMGVITQGDKLRVLEEFAKVLQNFVREENNNG